MVVFKSMGGITVATSTIYYIVYGINPFLWLYWLFFLLQEFKEKSDQIKITLMAIVWFSVKFSLKETYAWIHTHHYPIHSPVTAITAPMCQFERAAFRECNSCCTCLEVATEIKHIGVKKCQSASPWLLQSTSWQRSGKAPDPGMLCPSVNTELPSLADVIERIFVTWPWVDFITWPGSIARGLRVAEKLLACIKRSCTHVCLYPIKRQSGLDFGLIKALKGLLL